MQKTGAELDKITAEHEANIKGITRFKGLVKLILRMLRQQHPKTRSLVSLQRLSLQNQTEHDVVWMPLLEMDKHCLRRSILTEVLVRRL